ncbi:MAG TPA: peptidoglycan DD-metalloendopeptidase family protein [Methylomirabilota bacterium]|nr:peptidoglycan DD-metalloendopeptidase family protein [Methylomirabilota bacterium]
MWRFGRRIVVLAVAGLAAGLLDPSAHAGPPRSGRQNLKAKQEALGEVRRQLDEARERASAARRREISLLAELEGIDRTLALKRAALQQLDRRIVQVESELDALEGRRDRVVEDLVSQQAALSARLETLARLAAVPAMPPWAAGAATLARQRAVADLAGIARDDLDRLTRYDATADRLAARQEAAGRARRELVELRGAVDAERAQVAAQAERRRTLLSETREDRATHERLAGELTEAARRLETLVRSLARRAPAKRAVARATPAPAPGPAVGFGRERGQLPWPTEGRVVASFGRETHPRFGTETVRTGIDIEAPEGTPIRAVAPGSVAYRGWLKGYGNLLVLDHGDGYYTLYAHASQILVDEGDQVKGGELIGRVGETGSVEGPRLHFEVRSQSRAEDPQLWLRRRS